MKLVFDAAISEVNTSTTGILFDKEVVDKLSLVPNLNFDMAGIARKMFESNKLYKVTIEEAKGE